VLNLSDFSYSIRKDCGTQFEQFSRAVSLNNRDVLVVDTYDNYNNWETTDAYLYGLDETKTSKNPLNNLPQNAIVLFATTTLFIPNYTKVEHLIARFMQHADLEYKSDVYLFIVGSRDGVEWKILTKGKITNLDKQMQGMQIRRCFTSCRYFQFVFAVKGNTGSDRLLNYFGGFAFDYIKNDYDKKIR
jgi:hypothetical protein